MLTPELKKLKASLEGSPTEINQKNLLQELNALDIPIKRSLSMRVKKYMPLDLDIHRPAGKILRDLGPAPGSVCPTCGRPFRKGGRS